MKTTLIVLTLFIVQTGFSQSTTWKFDKNHSKIEFSAVHMGISEVTGQFKSFEGTIKADKADFTDAEVNIAIDASSIDTDNEKRDGHLKGEDFLHVGEYPEIKFDGKSLKKVKGDNYKLTGDLTIRDVTKTKTFDVIYRGTVEAMGNTIAGFKVTGTIDRFEFNVDWNQKFAKGLIVGEEIGITCNIELIKEK
ncbi:MAG: polyisoprenoid-binding protein [Bacteroidetes bacterium]|nr:polyisoprenoid-binding protein [Bacteroidota bacterium]